MKNRLMKLVAVLAVIGWILAGPAAYAMDGEDNPQGVKKVSKRLGEQSSVQKLSEMLNLTMPQREAVAALDAQQARTKGIEQQVKSKKQALDAAIDDPDLTAMDANDLIDEINTLQAQLFTRKTERLFALKKIITPEQFARMREMEKQPANMRSQGQAESSSGTGSGTEEANQQPE